jgi:hypothetical protein
MCESVSRQAEKLSAEKGGETFYNYVPARPNLSVS